MPSLKEDSQQKVYWRSLSEWADEPEVQTFLHREFPESHVGDPGSFSRRRFMQLMGASLALAGGSACRWEKEKILPFSRRPAGYMQGSVKHFATAMEIGGTAYPLSVSSYDGRPVKVDGNPSHPESMGASHAYAQASVLELYDPDRSQHGVRRGGDGNAPTWEDCEAFLRGVMAAESARGGAGLRILSEATSSPTVNRLKKTLLEKYPQARWVEYEPVHRSNGLLGVQKHLGWSDACRPYYRLGKAQVVVALDVCLLAEHADALRHARDFAQRRKPDAGEMSRLYAVESRHTHTGAAADHRLALRSEQVQPFVLALMAEVLSLPAYAAAPGQYATFRKAPQGGFLAKPEVAKFIQALARDLAAHQGASVLAVGENQAPEVHAVVHHFNMLLGAYSETLGWVVHGKVDESLCGFAGLQGLVSEMASGAVETLVILGGNPVYQSPAVLGFAGALKKVKNSVHVSLYQDETSSLCSWHVPRAHYLESWGDARASDGSVLLVQPLIEPLYKGKTVVEVLAAMLGYVDASGRALVRETHALDDATWRASLQKGWIESTSGAFVSPPPVDFSQPSVSKRALAQEVSNGALEVVFVPSSSTFDGRFANNGWLQELPDFMTKMTWDNAAMFAPETAEALGVKNQTLVDLTVGGRTLRMAAYIMPGQAAGSVSVALGYGRTSSGHVGGLASEEVASVGFNTYALLGTSSVMCETSLGVKPTSEVYKLALTQDHHLIDAVGMEGRADRLGVLVREGTLAEYKKKPSFAKEKVEHPPLESPWKEPSYEEGYRWGMSIDLSTCTGCNACVVACQSENNIPVVGKEQVLKGREMHWLRIDRYFSGGIDNPQVLSQPMPCQQCENAPCEQVCPVAATIHSTEGLNDMVYNRCIGTRYCSNNCPYKVRRFNYFNFHKDLEKPENQVKKMVYNPEVTVRARGVMEKCTYCVQRISAAKVVAKNERRPLKDGEVQTACAQACPSQSIVFGDLNDPNSAVSRMHALARRYDLLGELNTKPRTVYLAKIRNPNPELV